MLKDGGKEPLLQNDFCFSFCVSLTVSARLVIAEILINTLLKILLTKASVRSYLLIWLLVPSGDCTRGDKETDKAMIRDKKEETRRKEKSVTVVKNNHVRNGILKLIKKKRARLVFSKCKVRKCVSFSWGIEYSGRAAESRGPVCLCCPCRRSWRWRWRCPPHSFPQHCPVAGLDADKRPC